MPKTVDNYLIQKSLFKDEFQIEYFLSEHKVLKKPFTLKKIQKPVEDCHSKQEQKLKIFRQFVYSCMENQIQILRQLKSDKVIKCLKLLKAKNSIYAVFEQHPQKRLDQILSTQYLTFQKKQTILNEILTFIKQIHQQNIAIGNIQPCYLYFTQDFKLKTSNFLISRKITSQTQAQTESQFLDKKCKFYAPELLSKGLFSKTADIYSLGIIFKDLKLERQEHELMIPNAFTYQNLKQLLQRMLNQNSLLRPSIQQIIKFFSLNRSRNRSTCSSNNSNQEKISDVKGLESYKSEATLRFFTDKMQSSQLQQSSSKKTLLLKRQSLNPNYLQINKSKKINLKQRASLNPDLNIQGSSVLTLQIPTIKKSRGEESSKSGSSSNNNQHKDKKQTCKGKIKEVMLTRNLVSFLIQMALFVYSEPNFQDLSYYLINEAINYTQNLIKLIQFISKQDKLQNKEFQQFLEDSKRQKQKLLQIAIGFNSLNQTKGSQQIIMLEELKKFGKFILTNYSFIFSCQSRTSQVSDSLSRNKFVNQVQKQKQNQDKLFKTLLILKRLEYDSYYDFFKAKIHHPQKKFWNQHYFQFQKTFGGKYFILQIKDLISKK